MTLTISVERVKEKCGLIGSAMDTTIENLIDEIQPVIEYGIGGIFLADVSNAGLQATLTLGAIEVVCGELLAQVRRDPGVSETLTFGEVSIVPGPIVSVSDPSGLVRNGLKRLAPYLRAPSNLNGEERVSSVGGKLGSGS